VTDELHPPLPIPDAELQAWQHDAQLGLGIGPLEALRLIVEVYRLRALLAPPPAASGPGGPSTPGEGFCPDCGAPWRHGAIAHQADCPRRAPREGLCAGPTAG
jgi:hypothetical protein